MGLATRTCKVCGKVYEACHTNKSTAGQLRWQDVSCSPECGQKYFEAIRKSREKTKPAEAEPSTPEIWIDAE